MTSAAEYPDDLLYNAEHDWARVEGEVATFGITWYAQEQLGEIVFWDGAEVGASLVKGSSYTELESVKAVSEVVAPLSGEVIEVNDAALASPQVVNESPYGDGWLVRVALSSPEEAGELLSPADYRELVG
jgi:glycine cleavage system H protein